MKVKQLNEAAPKLDDKTLDQALSDEEKEAVEKADELLDEPDIIMQEGQIEKALDAAYEYNLTENELGGNDFNNLLFVGPAGTGKTSRIQAWARKKGVNLVKVLASVMDETDLGGAISPDQEDGDTVKRLSTQEFDELENSVDENGVPNAVLFLDEFNRAPDQVRGTLLSLINDHTIRDDRVRGKQRKLTNFLFTVAAINDDDGNYNVNPLDDAEMSRFEEIPVLHDKRATWAYITKKLNTYIASGKRQEMVNKWENQKELAKVLLNNKSFKFDSAEDVQKSHESGNGKILTGRTFTMAILKCDGTKEGLLDIWNRYCNSMKKDTVERALTNFVSVEDKANQALKDHETQSDVLVDDEEDVFANPTSSWDKIQQALGKDHI